MKITRNGREFEIETSPGLEDKMSAEELEDSIDLLLALILAKHDEDGED